MDHPFTSLLRRLGSLFRHLPCLLFAVLGPSALACTASTTGGALGNVSTQQVKGGSAVTGSGNFLYTCGSVVLSALSGTPSLKGTLQPSQTGLTLKSGANAIPYQVFSNAGMTTTYAGGAIVVNLIGANVISLINGAGGQVPVYISTTPGANIPAGTYTDTLQVTWTAANICEGLVNVLGLCLGTLNNATTVSSLVVTLTVSNDCLITAPSVSFGSAPLVSGFPTVSQSISLLCSRSLTYTVGLGNGTAPLNGRRQMGNGANRLAYDLYKADNTVWGNLAIARASGPAAADGVTVQTIPYTARVYQNQGTPAVGVYTDSVVVDVSF
ncbi:MAG: hypothetical protein JWQ88_3714 [Rhodoferax sp.]|nr:hypothetical protein [Rhodoferax sp.]